MVRAGRSGRNLLLEAKSSEEFTSLLRRERPLRGDIDALRSFSRVALSIHEFVMHRSPTVHSWGREIFFSDTARAEMLRSLDMELDLELSMLEGRSYLVVE